jgi:hypothetical protein
MQIDESAQRLSDERACGLRDVSLWLFAKRTEADAWSEESGPGF